MNNRPKASRFHFFLLICPLIAILLALFLRQSLFGPLSVSAQQADPAGAGGLVMSSAPVWESADSNVTPSLAWGDVDNDGDLDLVAGHSSYSLTNPQEPATAFQDGKANRLYLNENGQLNPVAVWESPVANTLSVAWGDIDQDGDLDLATGNDGQNAVYRNQDGMLSAQPVWQSAEAEVTRSVAWGDLNGDGIYELVAGNPGTGDRIYDVYTAITSGKAESAGLPLGSGSDDLALADYDRDTLLDIATSGGILYKGSDLRYRGDGTDDFSAVEPDELNSPCKSIDSRRIAWGWGYGGDNAQPDLAFAGLWSSAAALATNLMDPASACEQVVKDAPWTNAVAWVDADGDGTLEISYALFESGITVHSPGIDNPLWQSPEDFTTESLAWADFDGDGDLDLAAGGYNQPVRLFRNETSHFPSRAATSQPNTGDQVTPPWADVDGDGIYDQEMKVDGEYISMTAWGDYDNDGYIDLARAVRFGPNQLYRNWPGEELRPEPTWVFSDTEITKYVAWGDVNGDGWLDLAVGNQPRSSITHPGAIPPSVGQDQVFLNIAGQLQTEPVWTSADDHPTDIMRWFDIDSDGDLDLLARDSWFERNQDRLYLNDRGLLSPAAIWIPHDARYFMDPRVDLNQDGVGDIIGVDGTPYLSHHLPVHPNYPGADALTIAFDKPGLLAPAHTPSQGQYIEDGRIAFNYILNGPTQRRYNVTGYFSLDGGLTWSKAVPTTETQTEALVIVPGNPLTYTWDVFGSGLVGTSDNTRFRLQVRPSVVPQPHSIPGLYQRPYAQTETWPFRVRGKQVRVVDAQGGNVEGAVGYLLAENSQTALLMGSPLTGQSFDTNGEGYLNGRVTMPEGSELLAMLPMTQAYRIPPQLIFDHNAEAIQVKTAGRSVTDTIGALDALSAEMWLFPTSDSAALLALGDDTRLAYQTISNTTTISLTVAGEAVQTDPVPWHDGAPHHLAFSWSRANESNDGAVALYVDGKRAVSNTVSVTQPLEIAPIAIGEGFEGTLDEIRLWDTVRQPITETIFAGNRVFATSGNTLLGSTLVSAAEKADLIGYWPVTQEDGLTVKDHSGNGNDLALAANVSVAFKPLYTLYHTSAAITNTTVASATNGVLFTPVTAGGVQTLTVAGDNPLLLFDLDVSLEWDARNDTLFLQQLDQSFQDASALLYDITDGQVALGQINLFHAKAYWGAADIIIRADNSLRPSAAIGGVANGPVDDPGNAAEDKSPYDDAYLPGQIRMGTAWDPYGENTADLGVDWSRALAHELAHYLLFLPDNYIGIEDDILRRVYCPESFMTTTNNPAVSELLYGERWNAGECPLTLAENLTGRSDWQTVRAFYAMLRDPEAWGTVDGPSDLPLAVTYLVPWAPADDTRPFADRNFDIRGADQQRARLPDAQVFLFKTYSATIPTDDVLIPLGTPTGGGDRIKVRGAEDGDRLCLFGAAYSGCIDEINRTTVTIPVEDISAAKWQPDISAQSLDGRTITVTIEFEQMITETATIQLFPMHYRSIVGNAPVQEAISSGDGKTFSATFMLPLPAYEIAVRVWQGRENPVNGREVIDVLLLNPPNWDASGAQGSGTIELLYSPLTAGPNSTIVGGPNSTIVGGPNSTIVGGPNSTIVGGPNSTIVGGPNSTIVGGPNSTIVGGSGRVLLGNPNSTIVGGPNSTIVGGPNSTIVGGGSRTASAPISSADAQLIIYNRNNIFDENGVASVQAVANLPCRPAGFVPVGQAYSVILEERGLDRFIAFTYLQRDVPAGYEHTLGIYFLSDSALDSCTWQSIGDSEGLVENLVVAELADEDGTYGLFATIPVTLSPGWNLLSYPLPVTRTVTQTLASIDGKYDPGRVLVAEGIIEQVTITAYALTIRSRPDVRSERLGFLPNGATVRVLALQEGWWEIECPRRVTDERCWISSRFTTPAEAFVSAGSAMVTEFEFGQTYWVYVTSVEALTLYLAPPVLGADGRLQN